MSRSALDASFRTDDHEEDEDYDEYLLGTQPNRASTSAAAAGGTPTRVNGGAVESQDQSAIIAQLLSQIQRQHELMERMFVQAQSQSPPPAPPFSVQPL